MELKNEKQFRKTINWFKSEQDYSVCHCCNAVHCCRSFCFFFIMDKFERCSRNYSARGCPNRTWKGSLIPTEAGRATPVIAVTASAFKDKKEEILAAGASAYIRKPFWEEELYEALGKYLGLSFVYEEESAEVQKHPMAKELAPENLAVLPRDLVQAMLEALAEGDITRLLELIRQVEPLDKDTARGLKAMADRYDYPTLEKCTCTKPRKRATTTRGNHEKGQPQGEKKGNHRGLPLRS
ncbi:MAG: response regulator [Thermodesulfobacteriota bacterium]|nr:response regulator [Thermodesulfobacteriota bacterium]